MIEDFLGCFGFGFGGGFGFGFVFGLGFGFVFGLGFLFRRAFEIALLRLRSLRTEVSLSFGFVKHSGNFRRCLRVGGFAGGEIVMFGGGMDANLAGN